MNDTPEPRKPLVSEELTEELTATVATLTRFGVTLAGLPLAVLPQRQRERAKQIAGEVLRIGAAVPRTIGTMLEEMSDEMKSDAKPREDLGSRLRREQELED